MTNRASYVPPDASPPVAVVPPGIAPPIPVHPDQVGIAHRLHLIASAVPPRYPVTVTARDLLALLNGFWQESRRADQAEMRLQSLQESAPARNDTAN
jgi:hypothetical protein